MNKIKIAIVGVGNCASSLIQGIHYYRDKTSEEMVGLMHWNIGDYTPGDIEIVAAIDIDKRKVGIDVNDAIFSKPNCTAVFYPDVPNYGVTVHMGKRLDGFSEHMKNYNDNRTIYPLARKRLPSFMQIALWKQGLLLLTIFLFLLPVTRSGLQNSKKKIFLLLVMILSHNWGLQLLIEY
jgi:myo-inositol-1-phosphate synthase